MTDKNQLRGHCPACGSIQAVTKNGIAKHGYTVKFNYFSGTCSGSGYSPMEQDRVYTESYITTLNSFANKHNQNADELRKGNTYPLFITTNRIEIINGNHQAVVIDFDDATEYQQKDAVESAIWSEVRTSEMLLNHAEVLLNLLNKVHGKELEVATKPIPATRIVAGEQRDFGGKFVITCHHVKGASVFYKAGGYLAKMSTTKWRGMPLIQKEVV